MKLPDELRRAVEAAIGPVSDVRPITGGCISQAYRIDAGGGVFFVKADRSAPEDFFAVEAAGLVALRAATDLTVPNPFAYADVAGGWSWIALDWLEPGPIHSGYWERLGAGLAAMHSVRSASWGWDRPGYIGSLPQDNAPAGSWAEFWFRRRLEPQLLQARRTGDVGTTDEWDRLRDLLDDLLEPAENEGPSSLHGDLWGGNVVAAKSGPAIVDPAFYHGHREVDLAMMELFGGFDPRCFEAYLDAWPLTPGYERRRAIYQLYYLLVHVNLFGASYISRTSGMLRRALSGV